MTNEERKEDIYNCIVALSDIVAYPGDLSDFIQNTCVDCGEKLMLILKNL